MQTIYLWYCDRKLYNHVVCTDHECTECTIITFKFKQEHEFLPNPINTFLQILFCAPKIKGKIVNYERTINCLPSVLQLMRSVIYLRFVRKEYKLNKKQNFEEENNFYSQDFKISFLADKLSPAFVE